MYDERDPEVFCATKTAPITVDWVVLSAAIIGLGMVVLIPVAYSTESSNPEDCGRHPAPCRRLRQQLS